MTDAVERVRLGIACSMLLTGTRWRSVEEIRQGVGHPPLHDLIPKLNQLHHDGILERRLVHQRFEYRRNP